jgi:hypothetical protein
MPAAGYRARESDTPEEAMRTVPTTATMAIMLALAGTMSVPATAQAPGQQRQDLPRQDLPPMRERQELPTAPLPTAPKLNLTLEQRHTIREFIKDLTPPPASGPPEAPHGEAGAAPAAGGRRPQGAAGQVAPLLHRRPADRARRSVEQQGRRRDQAAGRLNQLLSLSMIFSENRFPLFGIMLYSTARV